MGPPGLGILHRSRPHRLNRLLVHAILLAGLLGVIAAVQLLVLLVLGRLPTDSERTVLIVAIVAAGVAALLYQPARRRLEEAVVRFRPVDREAPGDMMRALGLRLSRAVPLDELLLEVSEGRFAGGWRSRAPRSGQARVGCSSGRRPIPSASGPACRSPPPRSR